MVTSFNHIYSRNPLQFFQLTNKTIYTYIRVTKAAPSIGMLFWMDQEYELCLM